MIRIAPGFILPDDIATQSIAILARRGAGKTYTASVVVEEVVRANVPVVVLDPTGAWWGLRTSADGEKPGLAVTIFGGDHGDVPLEPTAGKVIADVVIEHPGAYVVDLSAFDSKASEIRFAGDFLERLYRAKRPESGPLLLVVDEADLFAPQRPGPEQTRTLGALEAIVRRGRIKGLGGLLITQRAAVLNKNVLTQTEVLVVMQTTGPQDRAAIDEWIAGNATRDQRDVVLDSLASLERGEAWVWSPSWLKLLQRVRIRERKTFDSSRTPEVGETRVEPRAFAKVDLDQLGERIRATVEQAKANDPAELRRQIAALKRELEQRPSETKVETVTERVEVPILTDADTKVLRHIGDTIETFRQFHADLIQAVVGRTIPTPLREQGERAPRGVPAQPAGGRDHTAAATLAPAAPRRDPAPAEPRATDGDVKLTKVQRAVLSVLAQFPDGRSAKQIAVMTGYAVGGSTMRTAIGGLRTAGFVTPAGVDPVQITESGREALGEYEPLPTGPDLAAYWMQQLPAGARRILQAILAAHPQLLDQAALADVTGYAAGGSTMRTGLGRLRTLELVDGFTVSPELL